MDTYIVGVGGCGVRVVDYIARNAPGFNLVAIEKEKSVLDRSLASHKLFIGEEGMSDSELFYFGVYLAEKHHEIILSFLRGFQSLVFVAGLGQTSSGILPVMARTVKDLGLPMKVIVSTPLGFEGKVCAARAARAVSALQAENIDMRILSMDTETAGLSKQFATVRDAIEKMDEIMARYALEAAQAMQRAGDCNE
jgi:cell division GTPase FtsZ